MKSKWSSAFFFCTFVLIAGVVFTQAPHALANPPQSPNQAYFMALPDIPLMPNMKEVEDQSFVFDKAEGKVVESVGFLSATPSQDILSFYQDALQSLGWKAMNNKAFSRNNEQMTLKIEELPHGVQVRFRLSPQPLPMSR